MAFVKQQCGGWRLHGVISEKYIDKIRDEISIFAKFVWGSAQLTGGAPGLQIRCGALKTSRVGSIPMHFRHIPFKSLQVYCQNSTPELPRDRPTG